MDQRSSQFFGRVVYSSSNEDGSSERKALRITGDDAAVTVLGSGARAFELLIGSASSGGGARGEIVAVDQNVHQCALAHLKVAAYGLDYADFAGFLGLSSLPSGRRLALYRSRLRGGLRDEWRRYWDGRAKEIEAGVLYGGTWESYFRWFARAAGFKGRALRALFGAEDLESQKHVWDTQWCDWRWRLGLWGFGRRFVWRHLLREPGIERIDPGLDIAATLSARFDRCMGSRLAAETPYLHLLLRGRYGEDGPLPDHLSEAYFEEVRSQLDRVRIVHAPLAEFLEESPGSFDGFSLSDVSSYADAEGHLRIWRAVMGAARPGARVCERYFLAEGAGEESLGAAAAGRFFRDPELEARLERDDDTFLYRFRCGEVVR